MRRPYRIHRRRLAALREGASRLEGLLDCLHGGPLAHHSGLKLQGMGQIVFSCSTFKNEVQLRLFHSPLFRDIQFHIVRAMLGIL